jgi:hypothetical protein
MKTDKHTLALIAALGATGVEVFCVYDGLKNATAAQLAAGVAIAILAPLVPAYMEGARRYFAMFVFAFALACVIVASGSRVGGAIDRAAGERAQAARASKMAEESEQDLSELLRDAKAAKKKACPEGREKTKACGEATKRVDVLLGQTLTARTTLTSAPVVAGEGDIARVSAWLGGILSEHQVRLYLPLLWPITMALVGAFFWGVWGDSRTANLPPPVTAEPARARIAHVAEVLPPIAVPAIEPPALPVGDVRVFILACLPKSKGNDATLGAVYARYCRWCDDGKMAALNLKAFGDEIKSISQRYGLRIRTKQGKVYCVDVRLVA